MDKIELILQQMTLEDKIALCSGENFWETKSYEKYGIPSIHLSDGPNGLRKQAGERRRYAGSKRIPARHLFPVRRHHRRQLGSGDA